MITNTPTPEYLADDQRYKQMHYERCGNSGLKLPKLAFGLWQNFGAVDNSIISRDLLRCAFDSGINHFDLANNYGPPYGSAESTFGTLFRTDFKSYRDEMLISSKAGYDMWPGPYGIGGSRKYLISSCDQSLKRTGLEYFDIFYHHCMDPETPLEETMQALDYIVRSGRALYVGISNYSPEQTQSAATILRSLGTPLLIHQPRYNLFDRAIEKELCPMLKQEGIGAIAFSPLAQGMLTEKYLNGIPKESRAANKHCIYLDKKDIDNQKISTISALNTIAEKRGQSLAQMAVAWVLNNPAITSCLIGASRVEQIQDSVKALENLIFTKSEKEEINALTIQKRIIPN